MAAIVNQGSGTLAAGTSDNVTIGWTAKTGNSLLVFVALRSTVSSCTVTATGATFSQVIAPTAAVAGNSEQCYNLAIAITQDITQITIASGNSVVKAWCVVEVSGIAASQDDGHGADTPSASTTAKGHSITTVQAADIVFQTISNSNNAGTQIASAGPSAVAGTTDPTWQSLANISNSGGNNGSIGIAVAGAVVSVAATYQAQWTTGSAAWTGFGIALKIASSANFFHFFPLGH